MDYPSRIVFINHWAKSLGGAEYSLIDIIANSASRADTHLITAEEGVLAEAARHSGATCHIIKSHASLGSIRRDHLFLSLLRSFPAALSFICFSLQVAQRIRSIRPTVIHANVPKSHITLMLCRLWGIKNIRFVFHIREIFKQRSLVCHLYRVLFPAKESLIIAISQAVKDALPTRLRRQAAVIYNGILIPPQIRLRAQPPTIKLLTLGRIVPWKGCHLLVDMFAALRCRNPQLSIEFTLVGDTVYWTDDYRAAIKNQIKQLNLESACSLLPHDADPATVFDHHHLFCSMSHAEPFGRVLAEAMAHGLPVVAYDGGGVREVVDDSKTGIVVPFGDQAGFIDAVERLIHNYPLMQTMGEQGYIRAKKMFNRDVQIPLIVERILNEYEGANNYSPVRNNYSPAN